MRSEFNFRVLVVEDDDFQRRTVVRYLKAAGALSVADAADGVSALSVISGLPERVDLIICDVQMPGMDGIEFLRRLQELGHRPSIILCSALDRRLLGSISAMGQAYGLNLLGIIEKPLTVDKMMTLLAKYKSPAHPAVDPCIALQFSVDEIHEGLRAGQFEPFFQPQVEIATERVTGMEALARWRHPVHGVVGPAAFIPLLEQSGQIDELTDEVLRLATSACLGWLSMQSSLTVAVNLSSASLAKPDIAGRLTKVVLDQGLDPSRVIFEVTETAVATNLASALGHMARLRMRGFGLSIDDYGTGYSSIQQLSRVAFSELKIDRAFVTNARTEPAVAVILSSSLEMARRLGITAVAEGVETDDDWTFLKMLNCDIAQGYLVARPMSGEAVAEWLENWTRTH